MDVSPYLISALLNTGVVHPWSHIDAANKAGIPARIDYRNFVENIDKSRLSQEDKVPFYSSGFRGQDIIGQALGGTSIERPNWIVNGISKLLYPLGAKYLSKGAYTSTADISDLRQSGESLAYPMLILSALADVGYNTKDRNITLDERDGRLVLLFNKEF